MRLPWCNEQCEEVQNLTKRLRRKYQSKLAKLKNDYASRRAHTATSQQSSSLPPLI